MPQILTVTTVVTTAMSLQPASIEMFNDTQTACMLRVTYLLAARGASPGGETEGLNISSVQLSSLLQTVRRGSETVSSSLSPDELAVLNRESCDGQLACTAASCTRLLVAERQLATRALQAAGNGTGLPEVTVGVTIKINEDVSIVQAASANANANASAANVTTGVQVQAARIVDATTSLLAGIQSVSWGNDSATTVAGNATAQPATRAFATMFSRLVTAAASLDLPPPAAVVVPESGRPTLVVTRAITGPAASASPSAAPLFKRLVSAAVSNSGSVAAAVTVVAILAIPSALLGVAYCQYAGLRRRVQQIADACAPYRTDASVPKIRNVTPKVTHNPMTSARLPTTTNLKSVPHSILLPLATKLLDMTLDSAGKGSGAYNHGRRQAPIAKPQRPRARLSIYANASVRGNPQQASKGPEIGPAPADGEWNGLFSAIPVVKAPRMSVLSTIAVVKNDVQNSESLQSCVRHATDVLSGYMDSRITSHVCSLAMRLSVDVLADVIAQHARPVEKVDVPDSGSAVTEPGPTVPGRARRHTVFEPVQAGRQRRGSVAASWTGAGAATGTPPEPSIITVANPMRDGDARAGMAELRGPQRRGAIAGIASAVQYAYYETQMMLATSASRSTGGQYLPDTKIRQNGFPRPAKAHFSDLVHGTLTSALVDRGDRGGLMIPLSAFPASSLDRIRRAIDNGLKTGEVADLLSGHQVLDFGEDVAAEKSAVSNKADQVAWISAVTFREFLQHWTASFSHRFCVSRCRYQPSVTGRVAMAYQLIQAQSTARRRNTLLVGPLAS